MITNSRASYGGMSGSAVVCLGVSRAVRLLVRSATRWRRVVSRASARGMQAWTAA
jgi:hypothetical protein